MFLGKKEVWLTVANLTGDLANARDVGTAVPGIRRGTLWRADAPYSPHDGPGEAVNWPPAIVIDLRDSRERGATHPYADSATVVQLPLMADASADHLSHVPTLGDLYLGMIAPGPAQLLVRIMEIVAEADGAVLVHCAAGKDRTGVSVALALSLVGTRREDIVTDYMMTTVNMPAVLQRMTNPGGVHHGAVFDPSTFAPEMLTTHAGAIGAVLDAWETNGGAEKWFLAAGGSQQTLEALRNRLAA